MSPPLEARLERIVRGAPTVMHVLRTVRDLDLPDWFLFSGAIYQRVLNDLTGRDADYGVKDYDIAYHDASDTSYEAEDVVIRRVAAAFEPPLRDKVEVRNQARVHLWFEGKFGEPYGPLANSAESLERFVSPLFAVAAKLDADDRLTFMAPFGLEDLFSLTLRPNPLRPTKNFDRVATGIAARWPEVKIVQA
jgi:uncharacterized protein